MSLTHKNETKDKELFSFRHHGSRKGKRDLMTAGAVKANTWRPRGGFLSLRTVRWCELSWGQKVAGQSTWTASSQPGQRGTPHRKPSISDMRLFSCFPPCVAERAHFQEFCLNAFLSPHPTFFFVFKFGCSLGLPESKCSLVILRKPGGWAIRWAWTMLGWSFRGAALNEKVGWEPLHGTVWRCFDPAKKRWSETVQCSVDQLREVGGRWPSQPDLHPIIRQSLFSSYLAPSPPPWNWRKAFFSCPRIHFSG